MTSILKVDNIKDSADNQAMSISSGVVTINNGINWGNENLTSYREGTWSPVFTSTSCTFGSNGYSVGTYTKIGNVCNLQFRMSAGTIGGTTSNQAFISGLPFTVKNTTDLISATMLYCIYINLNTNFYFLAGYHMPNTTTLALYQNGDNGGETTVTPAMFNANATQIRGSITYQTEA
tara:strand:- start:242 stop:772 length:531 start_codon:yes stop_codon:yes gene_type:complete